MTDYDQQDPGIYDAEKATNIGCASIVVGIILMIVLAIVLL